MFRTTNHLAATRALVNYLRNSKSTNQLSGTSQLNSKCDCFRYFTKCNLTSLDKRVLNNNILKPVTLLNYFQQTGYAKSSKSNKHKDKNARKAANEDEDDDQNDEEADDDDSVNDDFDIKSIDTTNFKPGFKIVKKHLPSLRIDSVLANGLGISRNKVDDYFYGNKLRLNGEKINKKSSSVKESDRVDMIGDKLPNIEKRPIKRVLLYKIINLDTESGKPLVVLISWKSGLNEDHLFTN